MQIRKNKFHEDLIDFGGAGFEYGAVHDMARWREEESLICDEFKAVYLIKSALKYYQLRNAISVTNGDQIRI